MCVGASICVASPGWNGHHSFYSGQRVSRRSPMQEKSFTDGVPVLLSTSNIWTSSYLSFLPPSSGRQVGLDMSDRTSLSFLK